MKKRRMKNSSSPLKPSVIKINAERKSKVDDNTARMQSIKQLGV